MRMACLCSAEANEGEALPDSAAASCLSAAASLPNQPLFIDDDFLVTIQGNCPEVKVLQSPPVKAKRS